MTVVGFVYNPFVRLILYKWDSAVIHLIFLMSLHTSAIFILFYKYRNLGFNVVSSRNEANAFKRIFLQIILRVL